MSFDFIPLFLPNLGAILNYTLQSNSCGPTDAATDAALVFQKESNLLRNHSKSSAMGEPSVIQVL